MSAYDDESVIDGSPTILDESFIAPPTFAAFSPVTLSANTPSRSSRRSTVLVHQKSPLLLATPPQITRALAYSHPFLLPLNTFVGLLTWSTGDPWQSFLFVCFFWFAVLYGDIILIRAGPVAVGIALIVAMYGRRYSPLSSSGWRNPEKPSKKKSSTKAQFTDADVDAGSSHAAPAAGKSGKGKADDSSAKHQKTLDEIVETLKEFTGRCNALMEPMLEMVDFLSTQRTATSATTKPALTAMFIRLVIVTPFWFALTMPPMRVITVRRVIMIVGTIALTWHARVMRVCRTILWRSKSVRRFAAAVTGLRFDAPVKNPAAAQLQAANSRGHGRTDSTRSTKSAGVKFTFIIYENQRRWIGLGWTNSLFAYERSAWTDEHHNSLPSKDQFELPHVEDGSRMEWQWAEGSRWRVDGVADEQGPVDYEGADGRNGWVYYDNKWNYGRRAVDGWGKWTRRRKWYRDAELVEVENSNRHQASAKDNASLHGKSDAASVVNIPTIVEEKVEEPNVKLIDDNASVYSTSSKSSFWPPMLRRRTTDKSAADKEKEKKEARGKRATENQDNEQDTSGLGIEVEMELQRQGKDGGQWGIGDDARMNLE